MNDFRYRMAKFFSGRAGVDNLGRAFARAGLLLMILTMITHSLIIYLLAMGCVGYSVWRMLSKNYQKRYYENQKYMERTAGIRSKLSGFTYNFRNFITDTKYKFRQQKIYKIFKCPSCKQKLRAPRGRGKIEVTCSKCHTVFIKKV